MNEVLVLDQSMHLGDRIWIWENLAQDKGLVNEVGKDLVVRG